MSSSKRIGLGAVAAALLLSQGASAAVDLSASLVVPEQGQSADRTRRDRYECHNWAVEQTGVLPGAADESGEAPGERAGRILGGASIGAALGGLIRGVQRKNPSNGVLAGAAVGAAVGAATGRDRAEERDPADHDYVRALSACLEGRGYRVAVPGEDGELVAASEG
jgi:hypothetical protein